MIETDYGDTYHTLLNHEEFLTLQLWNVESKNEDEIIKYINNILLKLSIEKDMCFKKADPIELWRDYGSAKTYGIQISDKKMETIPLTYMNYAITCGDPRMAFLHFYQVLEYFFVRAQNEKMIFELRSNHILTTTSINDTLLRQILKSYTNYTKEVESLKLVLQKTVNIQELKNYITDTPERLHQYTLDTSVSDKIQINLDAADKKL